MSNIVQISDFKGRYSIVSNGFKDVENQAFIDYYEPIYLQKILGAELYKLFIADLTNGVPQTQIYLDIYNPFVEDVDSCVITSDGIKAMLLSFIYFEIVRKSDAKRTLAGNTRNKSSNSDNVSQSSTGLWLYYNEGVNTADSIQWYIGENEVGYPKYNGQKQKKISWL